MNLRAPPDPKLAAQMQLWWAGGLTRLDPETEAEYNRRMAGNAERARELDELRADLRKIEARSRAEAKRQRAAAEAAKRDNAMLRLLKGRP